MKKEGIKKATFSSRFICFAFTALPGAPGYSSAVSFPTKGLMLHQEHDKGK